MEASDKRNSTTTQVQQDIDHFKEQYLHSLGLSLSRTSSSFLSPSSSILRRDSLSSVGTRRDSLSSSSSQEEGVFVTSSGVSEDGFSLVFTKRETISSSSALPSRTKSIESSSNKRVIQTEVLDTFDRDQLKEEYIKSLGLSHRPPKPKGLPCLKDRVSEFETLMIKSVYPIQKIPPVISSKNTAIHHKLPFASPSLAYRKPSSQMSSKHNIGFSTSPVTLSSTLPDSNADSCDTDEKCHSEKNCLELNTYTAGAVQLGQEGKTTTIYLPTDDQRNIPNIKDNVQIMLLESDQFSSGVDLRIPSSSNVSVSSLPLLDEENCQLSETKLTDENCQLSDTKLTDENCQLSETKLTDENCQLSDTKLTDENCQLSETKLTDENCGYSENDTNNKQVERALSHGSLRDTFDKLSTIASPRTESVNNKFTTDQTVIHKMYTETEKAFILESFRKSGGRQQRTLSLGSTCMNLQTENCHDNVMSKLPQSSRLPCLPVKSVAKIVNRFEDISQIQLKSKTLLRRSTSQITAGDNWDESIRFVQSLSDRSDDGPVQILLSDNGSADYDDQLTDEYKHQTDLINSNLSLQKIDQTRQDTFDEITEEIVNVLTDQSDVVCSEDVQMAVRHNMNDDIKTTTTTYSTNDDFVTSDRCNMSKFAEESNIKSGISEDYIAKRSMNSGENSKLYDERCAYSVNLTDEDVCIHHDVQEKSPLEHTDHTVIGYLGAELAIVNDSPTVFDKCNFEATRHDYKHIEVHNWNRIDTSCSHSVIGNTDLTDTSCSHSVIGNTDLIDLSCSHSVIGNTDLTDLSCSHSVIGNTDLTDASCSHSVIGNTDLIDMCSSLTDRHQEIDSNYHLVDTTAYNVCPVAQLDIDTTNVCPVSLLDIDINYHSVDTTASDVCPVALLDIDTTNVCPVSLLDIDTTNVCPVSLLDIDTTDVCPVTLDIDTNYHLVDTPTSDVCQTALVASNGSSNLINITENALKYVDETRNENSWKGNDLLDYNKVSCCLETERKESNLIEAVNSLSKSIVSNRPETISLLQSSDLFMFTLDEVSEVIVDTVVSEGIVDTVRSDEGNREVNINSDNVNVEQTSNIEHVSSDLLDNENAGRCVHSDMLDIGVLDNENSGRCVHNDMLDISELDNENSGRCVHNDMLDISELDNENSGRCAHNDMLDISVLDNENSGRCVHNDMLDISVLDNENSGRCVHNDIILDISVLDKVRDKQSSCWNNIPQIAFGTTYSENCDMSLEELVQNTTIMDLDQQLQTNIRPELVQKSLENDVATREVCTVMEADLITSYSLQSIEQIDYYGESSMDEGSVALSKDVDSLTNLRYPITCKLCHVEAHDKAEVDDKALCQQRNDSDETVYCYNTLHVFSQSDVREDNHSQTDVREDNHSQTDVREDNHSQTDVREDNQSQTDVREDNQSQTDVRDCNQQETNQVREEEIIAKDVLVSSDVARETVTGELLVASDVVRETVTGDVLVSSDVVRETVTGDVLVSSDVVRETVTGELLVSSDVVRETVTGDVLVSSDVFGETVTGDLLISSDVVEETVTGELLVSSDVVEETVTGQYAALLVDIAWRECLSEVYGFPRTNFNFLTDYRTYSHESSLVESTGVDGVLQIEPCIYVQQHDEGTPPFNTDITLESDVDKDSLVYDNDCETMRAIQDQSWGRDYINNNGCNISVLYSCDSSNSQIVELNDLCDVGKETCVSVHKKLIDSVLDNSRHCNSVLKLDGNTQEASVSKLDGNTQEVSVSKLDGNTQEVSVCKRDGNIQEASVSKLDGNTQEVSVLKLDGNTQEVSVLKLDGNTQDPSVCKRDGNTQDPSVCKRDGNIQEASVSKLDGNTQEVSVLKLDGNTQEANVLKLDGNTQDPSVCKRDGNIQEASVSKLDGNTQEVSVLKLDGNTQEANVLKLDGNTQDPSVCKRDGNIQEASVSKLDGNTQEVSVLKLDGNTQEANVLKLDGNTQDPSVCKRDGNTQEVSVCKRDGNIQEVSVCKRDGNTQEVSVCKRDGNIQEASVCKRDGNTQEASMSKLDGNIQEVSVSKLDGNTQDPSVCKRDGNTQDPSVCKRDGNTQEASVSKLDGNTQDPSVCKRDGNTQEASMSKLDGNIQEVSVSKLDGNIQEVSVSKLDDNTHEANASSTETFCNVSIPEPGVCCVRESLSDISESIDSFYSGTSELTESFHSVEDKDVFDDTNKDTCIIVRSALTTTRREEVVTPTYTNLNESYDNRELVPNCHQLQQSEQCQYQNGNEDMLGEIMQHFALSTFQIHQDEDSALFHNMDSSHKELDNNDNANRKYCDSFFESETSRNIESEIVTGSDLFFLSETEQTRENLQDVTMFQHFLESDLDYSSNRNQCDDSISNVPVTDSTEQYSSLNMNTIDAYIKKDENLEISENKNISMASELIKDKLEVIIRKETESEVYYVDDCVDDVGHQITLEQSKDNDINPAYIQMDLTDATKDPDNQLGNVRIDSNSQLVNTRHSCNIHITESPSMITSDASINNVENDNIISCLIEETLIDRDVQYLDSNIVAQTSPDAKSTGDVCNNDTTSMFMSYYDKQQHVEFTDSRDNKIAAVCCMQDGVLTQNGTTAENAAIIQLYPERNYDSNTESCDDGPESMERDSLEEDIDNSMEDSVDIVHGSERPTTIATGSKSSTSSQHQSSSVFPAYVESHNESPPMCSFSFDTQEVQLIETSISKSSPPGHIYSGLRDHSMILGKSQSTLLGLECKIKVKRWKEAEDASPVRVNTTNRSPRKVNEPFHLDLASTGMTEEVQVDMEELLESPNAALHRIPSASTFQPTLANGSRLDPYRFLERSQSDASLLKRDLDMMATDDDVHLTAAESSSGQNISECNRVYLDLSRAEPFERVELGETAGAMMRTSSGRLLETIPQDEELKTGDLSYVYASHRSFSQESSSSMEDLTFSPKNKSKDCAKYKNSGKTGQDNSITSSKSNLRSSFQIYSHSLKQKVRQLQMGSVPEQLNALTELNVLMEQAWSMPIYGKDLAYELCDILRTESALDIIVSNLASNNRELMKVSARLLEQSLTTSNRRQVAENGLELVVKMTHDARGDCELAQICTGILESLFKTSEDTCAKVIKLGGLDTITYWCRCNDRVTLKNCAIALSNLALYGGGENQQEMAKHKVPEWLFPLAFVEDDSVRYYALLAIGVLVSNKEIENAVTSSGTLALVLPFIDNHDPAEFAERDTSHRHGRSPGWLKRLIPVLSSKREEAQALAAFHFVMEAGIKSEQGRKEVLYKIGAVDPLKWLASTPNRVASKLAAQALKIIGEEIPHKLSQQVPLWTCDDVVHWIAQVGFGNFADKFKSCHVDGDLLLRLTEDELQDSLNMSCAITRKRFLRELRDLKISSDYTSCDPSMLGAWLQEVGEDMSQYTYQMLNQGVDRPLLRSLTDSLLVSDCKIVNGIHRMKILCKIEELRSSVSSPSCNRYDSIDAVSAAHSSLKTPIDVFISYRRSNGSQLASLLKVHLQLRGFTVFIDIEKLKAGKFDESLLESVRQAKNFIIVLTQNSLDRCMEDDDKKDWVHREITAAIDAGSNIIPLLDNFRWPSPETLPEDMRSICYFNAVRWIHDYQDACVDKLEKFLRGETNPQLRHPVSTVSTTCSSNNTPGFESPNSPPYQRAQGLRKMSSIESPVDSS